MEYDEHQSERRRTLWRTIATLGCGVLVAIGCIVVTVLAYAPQIVEVPLARLSPGNTPLYTAIQRKDYQRVTALLDAGADPNSTSRGLAFLLQFHGQLSYPDTALLTAINQRAPDIARTLLDHGADPDGRDGQGRTPLMVAVLTGQTDIVRALLDHRADLTAQDPSGHTALFYAKMQNNADIPAMLTQAGASQ
ncbi:MAG: ankyrin repeat domain-containing protein [Anaerolineae bacterium]